MNMRTKSIFPFGGSHCVVDIFGYSSKGLPGIEIVGLGKYSRSLKEKFIYLSRERNLKFPLRRYVLCIEGEVELKKFKDEEYRYLELPLLVMLWSLTGHLPLERLEDCFASGKVSIEGVVDPLRLSVLQQEQLTDIFGLEEEHSLRVIAPLNMVVDEKYYHLPVEGLFSSLAERL